MARISLLKKINLFSEYRSVLNSSRQEIEARYAARIDKAYRIYTVLNIPEELIGEAYSLKKSDIDKIAENYIKGYVSEIGTFLSSKNLSELFRVYEVKKVDKYSYLIVIGYSLFSSNEFYDRLYWRVLPAAGVAILIGLIIFALL